MNSPTPPGVRRPIRLTAGWRHEVATQAGSFASLEGGADDRWPASPAVVDVSLVALAGGPAVLGVGLAGRSHFSLSVRPCPRTADTLLFEAACRIHEPAIWLGSTYRGRGGEAVRIEAASTPAPATVIWSYAIGPAGVLATSPPSPAAPGELRLAAAPPIDHILEFRPPVVSLPDPERAPCSKSSSGSRPSGPTSMS